MTTKTQSSSTTSSPQSKQSLHHVNFKTDDNNKMNERKKRYLTAKYGQHQMNLIKKRLKVETWMYEQLQFLFDSVSKKIKRQKQKYFVIFFAISKHNIQDDNLNNIDIDLDEVLDLEGKIRKQWLRVSKNYPIISFFPLFESVFLFCFQFSGKINRCKKIQRIGRKIYCGIIGKG